APRSNCFNPEPVSITCAPKPAGKKSTSLSTSAAAASSPSKSRQEAPPHPATPAISPGCATNSATSSSEASSSTPAPTPSTSTSASGHYPLPHSGPELDQAAKVIAAFRASRTLRRPQRARSAAQSGAELLFDGRGRDEQQLVARLQGVVGLRDDDAPAAQDRHHRGVLGQQQRVHPVTGQ